VTRRHEAIDGNEAAARVAYALSEVIAIYPITRRPDGGVVRRVGGGGAAQSLGTVPTVVEMQSEGGASGALHGASRVARCARPSRRPRACC